MLSAFVAATATLLAIWVGYPIAVALLAAMRSTDRPPEDDDATRPTVTAVIASRDDAGAILDRVADVLAADYDPARLGVVVALDRGARASADELRALAAARFVGRSVVVVDGDAPGGKASALNAAIRAASGEILVFTDTHQRFHRDAITLLVRFLVARPRFGAVSGALDLVAPGAGIGAAAAAQPHRPTLAERYWEYEKWLRAGEARIHSTVGVTGAIYAMRHALWSPLPAGVILDDVYTPMRLVLAGHRVGFADEARAYDTRRFAAGQEYRRKVRTLTGVIQLCAWLPAVLVPLRNPIWLQFLFHKLLRLLTPYVAILAALAGVALCWRWLGPAPIAAAAALGVVASLLPRIGPRVRGLVVWGVTLQAAIVVAALNGLRGRWNVW